MVVGEGGRSTGVLLYNDETVHGPVLHDFVKAGLYRIWCGVHRLDEPSNCVVALTQHGAIINNIITLQFRNSREGNSSIKSTEGNKMLFQQQFTNYHVNILQYLTQHVKNCVLT